MSTTKEPINGPSQSSNLEYSNLNPVKKRGGKKSRNGCLTCKKKRLKCDETRPVCLTCIKKNIECGGYATRFKWRSLYDSDNSSSNQQQLEQQQPQQHHHYHYNQHPNKSLGSQVIPPLSVLELNNSPNPSNSMKRNMSTSSDDHDQSTFPRIKTEESNGNSLSYISRNGMNESPDSLRRHLELASISITGKSIKDIKIENDLIEQGFDPTNYMRRHGLENTSRNNAKLFANLGDSSLHMDPNNGSENDDDKESDPNQFRNKKLRRSQSVSDNSLLNKPRNMVRSLSTNTSQFPQSIYELRSRNSRNNSIGLNSLAEAAIDEINTRSPIIPNSPYATNDTGIDDDNDNHPGDSKSKNNNHHNNNHNSDNNNNDNNHRRQGGTSVIGPSTPEFLVPSSKPSGILGTSKSFNRSNPPHTFGLNHLHNQDYSNLNLSPSLSALINSAFKNDIDIQSLNLKDDPLSLDIPLSPLNLQHGDPLHDFMTGLTATSPEFTSTKLHHLLNSDSRLLHGDQHQPHEPSLLTPSTSFHPPDNNNDRSPVVQNIPRQQNSKEQRALSPNVNNTPLAISVEHDPYYNVQSNLSITLSAEQEQILGLYSHYTAGILSIKNAPYENPWRNIILPMSLHYSCLFNSIASVTLFHVAGNESIATNRDNIRARGYMYMKRCILELASGLSVSSEDADPTSKSLPADIALAACLNLAVSETWDKHTSSGIAHLKGAKTMIQNILSLLREAQKQLAIKRVQLLNNSTPSKTDQEEYDMLMKEQKQKLKSKLVLVEDSEWDGILSGSDDHHDINLEDNQRKTGGQNNKKDSLIRIPKSSQFLFNVWIYFEVLAQMTTESDEKGIDLVASITSIMHDSKHKNKTFSVKDDNNSNTSTFNNSPEIKSDASEITPNTDFSGNGNHKGFGNFFDNFENISVNSDEVDPLLGCAQSLFLIMGKVATLISKIRKNRKKHVNAPVRNSLFTITMATQLRQQLLSWKPTISKSMFDQNNNSLNSDPSSSEIFSSIVTAEAYRFAALLYLHQAVPEIPSSSSHQLAEKIFILLASIPTSSPTYTIHIFPLLVGSCEAEALEEREWCENRWKLLSNKLWIGNVDRAFEVVKEVWKRKDDYITRKKNNSLTSDDIFVSSGDDSDEKIKSISSQLSGLMAAVNGEQGPVDDISGSIYSKLHWSTIMKEWGWEVLLG